MCKYSTEIIHFSWQKGPNIDILSPKGTLPF